MARFFGSLIDQGALTTGARPRRDDDHHEDDHAPPGGEPRRGAHRARPRLPLARRGAARLRARPRRRRRHGGDARRGGDDRRVAAALRHDERRQRGEQHEEEEPATHDARDEPRIKTLDRRVESARIMYAASLSLDVSAGARVSHDGVREVARREAAHRRLGPARAAARRGDAALRERDVREDRAEVEHLRARADLHADRAVARAVVPVEDNRQYQNPAASQR